MAAGSGDESALPDESDSGKVMISRWRATERPSPPSSSGSSPAPSSSKTISTARSGNKALTQVAPHPLFPEISVRNVFSGRIFALFAEHNLSIYDEKPTSASDAVQRSFGDRGDWMVRIMDLPELTPSLEDSLLAACTARLGRVMNHPALVHESQRLYAKGLSAMRRDINRKSTQANEQNLAACLALMLYEISECPGETPDGYMVHYQGAMELMRIRGPAAHQFGLAHSVFQLLRLHSVSKRAGDSLLL